jgi:hypothetical protein
MLGGGAALEGNHLFIGLPHPLGADTTRFKRDANLPCWNACSTCHAGLLAIVPSASQGAVLSGAVPPETRPHSRVVVVSVEYSSRTLPRCWQLCRKCTHSPLRGTCQGVTPMAPGHHSCPQEWLETVSDSPVRHAFLARCDAPPVRYGGDGAGSGACTAPGGRAAVSGEPGSHGRQGVIGAAVWPEARRVRTAIGFPEWCAEHPECLGHQAVLAHWDAQRPLRGARGCGERPLSPRDRLTCCGCA